MSDRPAVLFVCVHNAGRSRMAAAFLDSIAPGRYEALSAGTEPAQRPHPEVVTAMAELGIEVADEPGTLLTTALADRAIRIIGMGCAVEETCPALRVPLEDWGLDDPKGQPIERIREIRDEIEHRVRALVDELDRERAT